MSCRGGVKGKGQREWVRCTARNTQEWLAWAVDKTGVQSVEEIPGRVASTLCASANGRRKKGLTGGPVKSATQSKEKSRGDVAQRATSDLNQMATINRGVEGCWNGGSIWTVDPRSKGLHVLVQLVDSAESARLVGSEPKE